MKRFTLLFTVFVTLLFMTAAVSAQNLRSIGARKVALDDGTTTTNNVWLSNLGTGGSLLINSDGTTATELANATVALLDLSTIAAPFKGLLLPRVSVANEALIGGGTPPVSANGLTVYNTSGNTVDFWDGTSWRTSVAASTSSGGDNSLSVSNFFYRVVGAGNHTVTLPTPASAKNHIMVIKNDPTFTALQTTQVNPGAGLIDGAANIILTGPNTVMEFISDGVNWYVMSNN